MDESCPDVNSCPPCSEFRDCIDQAVTDCNNECIDCTSTRTGKFLACVEDETEARTINSGLHDAPTVEVGDYTCVEAIETTGENCDTEEETDCCSPYDTRFDEYHGFCEYTYNSILSEWHLSHNACMDNGLGTDPIPCSCDEVLPVSLGHDTNKMLQTSCAECSSPFQRSIDNSPTEGCCSWDAFFRLADDLMLEKNYSLESLQSECTQSVLEALSDDRKPAGSEFVSVANVSWVSSACPHGCCNGGTYDKQQTTQADCELNGGTWLGAGTNCCSGGTMSSFSIPVTNIGSGAGQCQIYATGSSSVSSSSTNPTTTVWELPVTITAISMAVHDPDPASGLGGILMSGTVTITYHHSQDSYAIQLIVPNTGADPSGEDSLILVGQTEEGCGDGTKTGTFVGSGAESHFPCYNGTVDPSNQIMFPWAGSFSFDYTYPS